VPATSRLGQRQGLASENLISSAVFPWDKVFIGLYYYGCIHVWLMVEGEGFKYCNWCQGLGLGDRVETCAPARPTCRCRGTRLGTPATILPSSTYDERPSPCSPCASDVCAWGEPRAPVHAPLRYSQSHAAAL